MKDVKMEFVTIEGESKPQMIYTPYVYAIVRDFSTFYTVDNGREVITVKKEDIDYGKVKTSNGKRA